MGLFDWLKIGLGALAGATLMAVPAYHFGKGEERETVKIEAARNALERIQNLEKNNAKFKSLPDRDRCLVFMRDSSLPNDACD